jgi:putative N-acetyltransferase (TIGR04045 family)
VTDVLSSPSSSVPEGEAAVLTVPTRHACRPVLGPDELTEHFRIRHEVFVREQRLFSHDDRDEHDGDPATIHVLGLVDGRPAGTVRLYPQSEPGLWKGDRLAVLPEHRRSHIGGPLVRTAVRLAGELGGCRMTASVQATNTRFFVTLGWTPLDDPYEYLGVQHQTMTIGFSA